LYLNSYSDSATKDSFLVRDIKTKALESSFTFFSADGDTLPFFEVIKNNKLLAAIVHSRYNSLAFTATQGDTLIFSFSYGYRPLTFIITKNDNRNYNIYLQREFHSGRFKNTKFLIRRNKLVEISTNESYARIKNGM
jgi:hypothetical protein